MILRTKIWALKYLWKMKYGLSSSYLWNFVDNISNRYLPLKIYYAFIMYAMLSAPLSAPILLLHHHLISMSPNVMKCFVNENPAVKVLCVSVVWKSFVHVIKQLATITSKIIKRSKYPSDKDYETNAVADCMAT